MTQAEVGETPETNVTAIGGGSTVVELLTKLDTGDDVEGDFGSQKGAEGEEEDQNPFVIQEPAPLHIKVRRAAAPELTDGSGPALTELEDDEIVDLADLEKPAPTIPELGSSMSSTSVEIPTLESSAPTGAQLVKATPVRAGDKPAMPVAVATQPAGGATPVRAGGGDTTTHASGEQYPLEAAHSEQPHADGSAGGNASNKCTVM